MRRKRERERLRACVCACDGDGLCRGLFAHTRRNVCPHTRRDRVNCLRNTTLQKVLEAALFEPGRLLFTKDLDKCPQHIPAAAHEVPFLATPFGVLFTELSGGPQVLHHSVGNGLRGEAWHGHGETAAQDQAMVRASEVG